MLKNVIDTPKMKLPSGLPFSKAIKKANHVYISGTTSFNELGEFVGEGNIREQTEQVLKNVLALVESAGGNIEDIVKINIYLKSISDFDSMNQVYKEFFSSVSFPSRTTIQAELAQERFMIEVEAEAILD